MGEAPLLDTRGSLCPMPVIRTQQRVAELQPGERLTILASDPGAAHDIPAWCRVHGHRLIRCEVAEGLVTVELEVCSE